MKKNEAVAPHAGSAVRSVRVAYTSSVSESMTERGGSVSTRFLLIAGVAIAPLFLTVSAIQAVIRPGFDVTRHEVSLLLVGPDGWVQTINFLATGALALLLAVGTWRHLHHRRAGTSAPILIGLSGVLFLAAGLNHPDGQLGFPRGSRAGVPPNQTVHSDLHSLAFSGLALAVVATCIVFARRFHSIGARAWEAGVIFAAMGILAFVAVGSALLPSGRGGLPLLGAALAITGAVSAIALRLVFETRNAESAVRKEDDRPSP